MTMVDKLITGGMSLGAAMDVANNAASPIPTDAAGNILANVIPRTGTLATLQALTTVKDNEVCVATDQAALVVLRSGATTPDTYTPVPTGLISQVGAATTIANTAQPLSTLTLTASSSVSMQGASTTAANTNGGAISNTAGSATGANSSGGNVGFSGGNGTVSGGSLTFLAGNGGSNGGSVTINAGNGTATAGNISLTTASVATANVNAGSINLTGGTALGTGLGSAINITSGQGATFAQDGGIALSATNATIKPTIFIARSAAAADGIGFFDKAAAFQAPAQPVGYGVPTGMATGAGKAAFPGATATLAQTSAALAALINDLKSLGLIGA